MERLSMLERMVGQKPDDPFPKYGLAMELRRLGRPDEASAAFDTLIAAHPDYVPAYLMAGNLLVEMGATERARSTYERGIQVAAAAGDDHAVGELEAARAELESA